MSTALYRRYRPETFAEVIGQDHVTAPLMQALRSGRVNHAYLFSGPRGCGKTTSARILARTLNCAQNTPENPLDTPCGECPSCVELARGGPGSLDVVEIDAASHGGVDDARDLRERATFAPTRDRYKIFIIDEAHMVSPAGFNALLKIVEEPPEHVKFVFATTEPDKVIGTIRSRTHHYPFRLVPPDVLGPYLEELCAAEGVGVGSGVFPLVTRAGGGSVRDSLSVMDQLIAGAENGQVDYERAVALLGYTHATLLDDVVDALAAHDGASIFRVVDHVIATGHEPRRFVEDVLERLRDLIVIAVSGDEAQAVLRDLPADQLARMRTQAQNLGVSELSRAADLVNTALTEMSGATSPRLHLELLVARLLLPGADDGAAGFAARLDRLERGGLGAAPPAPAAPGPVVIDRVPDAVPSAPPVPAPGSGLTGAAAVRAALGTAKAGSSTTSAATAPAIAPDAGRERPAPTSGAGDETSPAPDRGLTADPSAVAARADIDTDTEAGAAAPREHAPAGTAPARQDGEEAVPETSADRVEPADESPASEVPTGRSGSGETAPGQHATSEAASGAVAPGEAASGAAVPGGAASGAAVPGEVASGAAAPAMTTEELRRRWPEVLETLSASRATWSLVSMNAQVSELRPDVLYVAFPSAGLARTFSSSRHTGAVQDAVYQTLGLQVRVEARLAEDEPGHGGGSAPSEPGPAPTAGHGGSPAAPPDRASSPEPPAPPAPVAVVAPGATSSGTAPGAVAAPGGMAPSSAGSAAAGAHAAVLDGGRGGVALQERPVGEDVVAEAQGVVDAADEAWLAGAPVVVAAPARVDPTGPASSGGADPADDAWLAGAPLPGPPSDVDDGPEPEPVVEPGPVESEPADRAAPSVSREPVVPVRPEDPPRPAPSAPAPSSPAVTRPDGGPLRGASAARAAASAAIAAAASARDASRVADEPARRDVAPVPDPMDDLPSDDDPDIVATGLVGTALVVNLLDGKIIEEIHEQGA